MRENPSAANGIVEKPALFSLCPDFENKTVLDLGCGYGENCRESAKLGAKLVIGIDISEKMLQIATAENARHNIRFLRMSMNDFSSLNQKFDIVLSSLAVHYVEDFDALLTTVFDLLHDGGWFIFSQEHPLTTALKLKNGSRWSRDGDGNILHYNLTDYSLSGKRETDWIIDGVIKYHRPFSSILNSLISAGFCIEKVLEPLPDEKIIAQYPAYQKTVHKPDFLLVKARKR